MSPSISYVEFLKSLEIVEGLIKLDIYKEPPLPKNKNFVYGLRGGSAILIVASFEEFLNSLPETHMKVLIKNIKKIDQLKLPEIFHTTNVYTTLEHMKKNKDFNRIPDVKNACWLLFNDKINTEAFKLKGFTPRPDLIINLFRVIGISNILKDITFKFQKKWKKKIGTVIIKGKLNEIIERRNTVAHNTSMASRITKNDLNEAIKFLRIMASLLDIAYKRQIDFLCINAKIP